MTVIGQNFLIERVLYDPTIK